jgi:hypothetical protein
MADDKSHRGGQDRARVSGEQGYEVEYFARKHAITKGQAEKRSRSTARTARHSTPWRRS